MDKKLQQQTANAMGPCDVDKPQNLTLGHSGVILHTEGSPWLAVLMTSSVAGEETVMKKYFDH